MFGSHARLLLRPHVVTAAAGTAAVGAAAAAAAAAATVGSTWTSEAEGRRAGKGRSWQFAWSVLRWQQPQAAFCESVSGKAAHILIVNAGRVDYDAKMDLSRLEAVAEVTQFTDGSPTPEEVLRRVKAGKYDVVITKEIPVPADIIAQFPPEVRLIQEAGTGFNNIDLAAARTKGITVCNCPAYSTDAVAQLVITFVLNFSCSMIPQMRMLCNDNRDNFTACMKVPHFELQGKTLGLVGGGGSIGSKVSEMAVVMGMNVLVSSRNPRPSGHPNIEIVGLEELLERSDFVSLHCPLTTQTRHLIDKNALQKMKPSAFLINTARGPIIKEDDLVEALHAGTIAGAGLDVQDVEPPPSNSPLYTMESVVLTPHIGWKRLETRQRLMNIVADNIVAFLNQSPVNIVS